MTRLNQAFVMTVSASMTFACNSARPLPGNPPPPHSSEGSADGGTQQPLPTVNVPPDATSAPTTTPEPTTSSQPTRPERTGSANPRDEEGRSIRRAYQGDGCFVELPFPPLTPGEMRPPGSAPPTQNVSCPASMNDPAFTSCRGGTIEYAGESCKCFVPGNPPFVRPNACPR